MAVLGVFLGLAVQVAVPLRLSSVLLVSRGHGAVPRGAGPSHAMQTFSSVTRDTLVLGFPLRLAAEGVLPAPQAPRGLSLCPFQVVVPHAYPGQCVAKDPLGPAAHPCSSLLRVPCASASGCSGLPGFLADTGQFRVPLGFSLWCGLSLCAPGPGSLCFAVWRLGS